MASRSIAAASSSASSSTSTSSRCYDVFINHRGPDVKHNFASHLYRRLLGLGLQVFLDREELEEGHDISSQIEAAIRVASVQIAIFSPTYAESYWCLNELVLMVEQQRCSRAIILPVFYHVEPSMLRRATGPYGEALHNLQQKTTCNPRTGETKPRYDLDTVQSWREALSHVADISGFVLHGDEGELLEKVVEGVLKNVPKTPLDVAKYPTGLREKLQEFERTVQESKTAGAKVAGIVGSGGIGKTTLAKELFNLKRSDYKASSFLFDVRENARTMSLPYLQSKLIKELKHTDIKIESRDQGIGELKKHLSSCNALIILDDVDHIDQMEAFLPIKDILSQDSLILVTSRDKHVLRSSGILDSSIYNLNGLNRADSEELFCCYAFCQRHPQPGFADLVDRFVMACDGLPLSLKVFGALVCGQKEVSYWEEILDRLPPEIQERLRISYDSLYKDDQSIFLDIVCFFLGQKIDTAIKIWGMVGIKTLENKCLLDVDSENSIKVHDHIRDMGRCIAKEGSMPRRLYDQSTNNIVDILEQSPSVITEVRGISMVNCSWNHYYGLNSYSDMSPYKRWTHMVLGNYMWKLFNNSYSDMSPYKRWTHEVLGNHMWKLFNKDRYHGTNLKFLVMEGRCLRGILGRVKSPHLIWLRWFNCPYSSLPSWVPIDNLRVLEVSGEGLQMLWQSETQAPLQLRQLSIIAPLSHFPKSIGKLQHLEKIVVDCLKWSGSSLKTLPEEFCNLFSLKYLVLNRCSSMMSLPQSFGKLINLQHIDLSDARSLESLPESFGELTNLQHIDLSHAESLKSLPESFGRLLNLHYINMDGLFDLQMLPNSFGKLTNLQNLALRGAWGLQTLPDSFGELRNLQHLGLSSASCLETLPNSFGNLSRLKHLDLSECHNLIMSSGALGNITTLEYLNLSYCKNVKELPPQVARQPSLQELDLRGTGLKELPSGLGNLSNLEALPTCLET